MKKEALESGIEEAVRDREAAVAENAAHQAKCLQHEAEVCAVQCRTPLPLAPSEPVLQFALLTHQLLLHSHILFAFCLAFCLLPSHSTPCVAGQRIAAGRVTDPLSCAPCCALTLHNLCCHCCFYCCFYGCRHALLLRRPTS